MIENRAYKRVDIKREAKRMRENFGPNVKAARIKKGLTQEDLANRTGVTVGYISLMESSKRVPSIPIMLQLGAVLGLNYIDLFKGE